LKRIFRIILTLFLCAALATAGVLFGPRLYALLFRGSNATWVSERLSEALIEKRELVVLEKVLTGRETVSTDAWLIGTVQEVILPYSFSADFSVDLRKSSVDFDKGTGTIRVYLPQPTVSYYKLTVDEEAVEKHDLFYPLTAERYAEMLGELEQKLLGEVTSDLTLKESAWTSAVSETEALYQEVLKAGGANGAFAVQVLAAEPEAQE
jgi:hypothetical protein